MAPLDSIERTRIFTARAAFADGSVSAAAEVSSHRYCRLAAASVEIWKSPRRNVGRCMALSYGCHRVRVVTPPLSRSAICVRRSRQNTSLAATSKISKFEQKALASLGVSASSSVLPFTASVTALSMLVTAGSADAEQKSAANIANVTVMAARLGQFDIVSDLIHWRRRQRRVPSC